MSTSGLNPAGSLCFGANTTSGVSIGFNDAITIDNTTTPAKITINGTIYNGSGTSTDFTTLILSNAGFNPSGSLNIGTSNTNEITIGPLKIDNTVVPPQIYMNGVSLPPGSLTISGDKFLIHELYDYDGTDGYNPIYAYWAPPPTDAVKIIEYFFGRSALTLVESGIYDIRVNISVTNTTNTWTSPANFYWTPIPNSSGFTDINNNTISGSSILPGSNIEFIFDENSNTTFTDYIQFRIYTTGLNSAFILATDTIEGRLNKDGTDMTIKRIGDWPSAP